MEGGTEAHADGADDVPGEGIAHIGTAGGVRLDLMEGDQKNVGVWLAISGDRRKRHILKVIPDAVVFQNVKHLIEAGRVADDAQLHTQPLQPFQHFLHVGAEGTVIVGDLPHVGQLLGVGTHRIFIQAEIRQNEAAPDLLRLQLPLPGVPVSAVTFPAGIDALSRSFKVHVQIDAVSVQNIQHTLNGRMAAFVIDPDVLQSAAHIEQYSIYHSLTAFFLSCIHGKNGIQREFLRRSSHQELPKPISSGTGTIIPKSWRNRTDAP